MILNSPKTVREDILTLSFSDMEKEGKTSHCPLKSQLMHVLMASHKHIPPYKVCYPFARCRCWQGKASVS